MYPIKGRGSNDSLPETFCLQSNGGGEPVYLGLDRDQWCFSTAQFTYHMENEHSLQFQSHNSYAKQMLTRRSGLPSACIAFS